MVDQAGGESDPVATAIAEGDRLIMADDPGAIAFHLDLAERRPDDARVAFALAGAFDSAGREHEALTHYRRARELRLPADLRSRMVVQMGSTLRNVGDTRGAIALLEEGAAEDPADVAVACFLALARHSAGQPDAALAGLIRGLVDAADAGAIPMPRYRRSLRAYAEDLDGTGAAG